MTYRVGPIGEFAAWTKTIIRDPNLAKDIPKRWFDSETTAKATIENLGFDDRERGRWLRALLLRARSNAKRKNLPFDLTPEFLETLWQNGRCAVTGFQFNLQRFDKALVKHPFAPSIDRKHSAGGYTKENVRLVCVAVNFGMGQWGDEVFIQLAQAAMEQEKAAPAPPDAAWRAGYAERIAAVEALLPAASDAERARLRKRIAALKRALTLGPDGLRAAAAKAQASRATLDR
jgi:hypothetical protein